MPEAAPVVCYILSFVTMESALFTYLQKIKRLYHLPHEENFGFRETEIIELEKRLGIQLPSELKRYYLELGKNEQINHSHNRLLNPGKDIKFSKDRYLIFYEENQAVSCWGIKEADLQFDNPPVWGNYGTMRKPDWHMETKATDLFFLLMAVYNGTMGGLRYHANYLNPLDTEVYQLIQKRWTLVPEISWERQKIYTDNFDAVISASIDDRNNCAAIFIGTSNQQRFDKILDDINVNWSYISYEDDEDSEVE